MDLSLTQYLSLPVLQLAGEGGSVLGDDHYQEVPVLAVCGEHRPLLTDLAPVAARAGQGQRRQRHVVHAGLGELHTNPRQVVYSDGTRLTRQVTETKHVVMSQWAIVVIWILLCRYDYECTHTIYEHYNITHSPEELLAILVPPDTVDGLDAGVLAVEDRMLAVDPVLRHLDT